MYHYYAVLKHIYYVTRYKNRQSKLKFIIHPIIIGLYPIAARDELYFAEDANSG